VLTGRSQVAFRLASSSWSNDHDTAPGEYGRRSTRTMLNKVPEVTLYFWIIKIPCTTVGETAADFLNDNLGLAARQP
jgi:hypothetical protein